MLKNRLPFRSAPSNRGGFTLVELLVVIAIIGVLASVTVPAVMGGLTKANQNVGMQNARSIALLMFQFSIDNGAYPPTATATGQQTAPTSTAAFQQILLGQYTTSADIFFMKGTPGKSVYSGSTPSTGLTSANVSWDITGESPQGGGSVSGVQQTDPDQLPLVFTQGNTVNYTSPGPGAAIADSDGTNPFKTQGIPVCYKGNNATFAHVDVAPATISTFVPASFNAPTGLSYQALTP